MILCFFLMPVLVDWNWIELRMKLKLKLNWDRNWIEIDVMWRLWWLRSIEIGNRIFYSFHYLVRKSSRRYFCFSVHSANDKIEFELMFCICLIKSRKYAELFCTCNARMKTGGGSGGEVEEIQSRTWRTAWHRLALEIGYWSAIRPNEFEDENWRTRSLIFHLIAWKIFIEHRTPNEKTTAWVFELGFWAWAARKLSMAQSFVRSFVRLL